MKKLVLLFTVLLFTVIFVSCDKEDLFQNVDQEVTTGVEKCPESSDGIIPAWVSEYVTLEEYSILEDLSKNYNIDYSFITKDFYEDAKGDIYEYLDNMRKEMYSKKMKSTEKVDLYLFPNSNSNISTRSDGMNSQTEVIGMYDGVSVYCSFSFEYFVRPSFRVVKVSEKIFFAGPSKYEASLEGVGTARPENPLNSPNIDITYSGRLKYKLGNEYYERIIDCRKTVLGQK